MKKKISLFLGVLFLDLTAFLISSTCVSLSWFNKGFNINFDNQTGKSLANYFASGDGTKDKPYTITESIHFYNFAWLQYLGEFNKNATGTDSIAQKYFRLDKDINMSDIVVPPVGTATYPFVGNFDGNDKTINNLTVSNTFNDFGAKHPSVVNEDNFQTINIVGTFGVVGKLSTDLSYKTSINEVKNLYLDNVILKTNTPNLLVGIFAGYVNGNINNCGVHYSKIEIANNTKYYSTDNATVNGYINKNISNYTLLGAYNNADYYWDGEPGFNDGGNDFGGSIDLYNLDKRIHNINLRSDTNKKDKTQDNSLYNDYIRYTNQNFNLVNVSNYDNSTTNEYNNSEARSINDGSFLPLNVDVSKVDEYSNSSLVSEETILPNNTGYLVGGGYMSSTSGAIKIQRIAEKNLSEKKKLINFFIGDNTSQINATNIAFSYWDPTSKTTKRIKDKENEANFKDNNFINSNDPALSRYEDVKKDIIELLVNNKDKDSRFASPLLFFNKTDLTKQENIATLKEAYICGTSPKLNYQMYKGGINFTLTKSGRLAFVMPTIRDADKAEMFNLYKVMRNEKNQITGNKEMTDVLPSTGSGLNSQSIYYCEIPLEKGDYFLGATGSSKVPYFMYLDIGASASSTVETRTALTNVDFVDTTLVNGVKTLNKVDSTNLSKVAFKISGTFDSDYIYYFRRKGNTVYYYSSVPAFGFITPSSTGEKKKASGEACES